MAVPSACSGVRPLACVALARFQWGWELQPPQGQLISGILPWHLVGASANYLFWSQTPVLNSCQFSSREIWAPLFPYGEYLGNMRILPYGKYGSSEGTPFWSVFLFQLLPALSWVFRTNISYLLYCTCVF